MDYTTIEGLEESKISWDLEKKYFNRKIQKYMDAIALPVFLGLIIMAVYISMEVHALSYEVNKPVITLTLTN